MADPSFTAPDWVLVVGGLVGTGLAAFVAKLGLKAGASDKTANDKIVGMVAAAPTAERYTSEILVTTLNDVKSVLGRILERMEEDERERREDEKDELRDLKVEAKELRRQLHGKGVEYRARD